MENIDSELQHIAKSQENFMKDFIKTYKDNRVLWDKNHPKYKSRDERDVAFECLLSKTNEYFPEANLGFVKTKIDSIRGAFRREHKKVIESKKKAKSDEDIYTPTLWYYNLLLFSTGEEVEEEIEINKDVSKHIYAWSKDHTVLLIELLKKYPVLYSLEQQTTGNKSKRTKAYIDITRALINSVGRHFEVFEVKNKINTLKQQFRKEDRDQKQIKKSTRLWCYDLLLFLKQPSATKKRENLEEEEQDILEEETQTLWINYENVSNTDKKDETLFQEENHDDIFDTIGKHVAIKLRDMTDEQRIYAENLINEVMYNGLMENLTADSRIGFTAD